MLSVQPGTYFKSAIRYFTALLLAMVCATLGYFILMYVDMLCSFRHEDIAQTGSAWWPYLREYGWVYFSVGVMAFLLGYCIWKIIALFRKPRDQAPIRKGKLRLLVKILAGVVVVFTLFINAPILLMEIYMLGMKRDAGPFDRPRMEHIVEQVRAQHFEGEQFFFVDPAGNLTKQAPQNWTTEVWANHGDDGALNATIVTVNNGHAGAYGFVYSEKPQQPKKDTSPDSDGRLWLEAPGPLNETYSKDKIDDHWWKAFDDMD